MANKVTYHSLSNKSPELRYVSLFFRREIINFLEGIGLSYQTRIDRRGGPTTPTTSAVRNHSNFLVSRWLSFPCLFNDAPTEGICGSLHMQPADVAAARGGEGRGKKKVETVERRNGKRTKRVPQVKVFTNGVPLVKRFFLRWKTLKKLFSIS